MYTWGIKDFHKCWSGSLAKRRLCLGPAGVINCTSQSALSFWVSLFPRTCGYNSTYGCNKDCLILIPFRLSQISCFTVSLKCFSSDSDNCPDVGTRPLLQFPPHPPSWGLSSPTNTPVRPPLLPSSFFILLGFTWFCTSFLVVRYSCPLSSGVLQALLCLRVYSWCIYGERCTPRPPTPPPPCSLSKCLVHFNFYYAPGTSTKCFVYIHCINPSHRLMK